MDFLHNADLDSDFKIFILLYIFAFVLPQMLEEMPEIYKTSKRLKASYLLKKLKPNCE